MGLGASQARLLSLVARKSDLEMILQQINQGRMTYANIINNLSIRMANAANAGAKDDVSQAILNAVQQQDKKLELDGQRVNTQHEAIQTEIQAVQKVISNNIRSSFKLMASG